MTRRQPLVATFAILFVMGLSAAASAQPCGDPSECASGFCVDAVCCDSACDGVCSACSTLLKGGGPDGVCAAAAAGTECGIGSCDSSTFEFLPPDTCDAQGSCVPGGEPQPCNTNNECVLDLCSDTGCDKVVKPDGEPCGEGDVCLDGVCGGPGDGGAGPGTTAAVGSGGGGGKAPPVSTPAPDNGGGCHFAAAKQRPMWAVFGVLLAAAGWRRRRPQLRSH